ncbi:proteasome-interacting protein cic1 [Diatrype stigma]|uniref:Proteasome-interacting protein cic1 n=1 Tax=Diatrype stigma TaxID=117547 RepID=A0AAN9UNJ1_9PEZI
MAPSKEVAVKPDGPTIDPDQIFKASKALLAHMKKASKEKAANADKKNLLATSDDEDAFDEEPIWLTVSTKRHIAEARNLKPGKITLPHPLRTDPEMSICLITAEPQRAYKNLVAADDFPAEWRKRVTRVIDIGKLKTKYRSYESQRKLRGEHDVFLGDDRIITRLPQALGKSFYKSTAKRPIPVTITARLPKTADGKRAKRAKKNGGGKEGDAATVNACTPVQLAGEIERAVAAALVNLAPSAHTDVRVACAGWPVEHVAANVEAAARALVERFVPGKWRNVRGLYVKGSETTTLPVWLTEELWLEESDVVPDGSDKAKALLAAKAAKEASSEKPNIGKKRKSLGEQQETEAEGKPDRAEKKAKKAKTTNKAPVADKKVPEGDDAKLDKEISERKAALKKQKKAAKKALEVEV